MTAYRRMAGSIVGICVAALAAGHGAAVQIQPLAGVNLASGKKASYALKPNYGRCTDPGDATDLTDGKF